MTAISGVVGPANSPLIELCRQSLRAQSVFGGVAQVHDRGWICLGAASTKDVAAFCAAGPLSLIADARIDNRDELRQELGLALASDCELILELWMRHGDLAPKHLSGAFAFAVADDRTRVVHLVRDQVGSRPLVFARSNDAWAFSSMASGVLDFTSRTPNLEHLALRLRGKPSSAADTAWLDVELLPKASVASIRHGSREVTRYFDPWLCRMELHENDHVESFRHKLSRAVDLSLRSSGDPVAAHLSSGWDSSAVASNASRLMGREGRLLLYTAAPGFPERSLVDKDRIADEAAIAGLTAEWLGAEHRVIRDRTRIADQIRGRTRFFEDAVPNPANLGWWTAINEDAHGRGARVLLTGLSGNASISYGGVPTLAEYLSEGNIVRALREAVATRRRNRVSWKGLAFGAVAPFLTRTTAQWVTRIFRAQSVVIDSPFVSTAYRRFPATASGEQSSLGTIAARLRVLARTDDSIRNKGMEALTGIEERDPCAEPGLLEYCFGLPPSTRLQDGRLKPLLQDALRGSLPPTVIDQRTRGEQGSDWFARIDRTDCQELLEEARGCTAAQELLDFGKMAGAIDQWPTLDPGRRGRLLTYFMHLTDALAVGIFLSEAQRYPLGR